MRTDELNLLEVLVSSSPCNSGSAGTRARPYARSQVG